MSSIQRSLGANVSDSGARLIANASPVFPFGQTSGKATQATSDHAAVAISPQSNAEQILDPERSRRLAKVVWAVRSESASIVGVTGTRLGVGVSVIARELAFALSAFGGKILLVDLSRAENISPEGTAQADQEDVLKMVTPLGPVLTALVPEDLSRAPLSAAALRSQLQAAALAGFTVVLDLPHLLQPSGAPAALAATAGAFCDQVYLVCLTGETTEQEITVCAEACSIAGLKLNALILNDWRMPASGLISN